MNFIENLLESTLRAGTPLLYATLGAIIMERSGVMNLGLEGYMLMGAISGFAAAYGTGNLWMGLLVAFSVGALLGLLQAFLSVTLKVNQVVTGLAIAMIGTGISGIGGKNYIGKIAAQFEPVFIPFFSDIPFLGASLFRQDLMVYLGLLLVLVSWIYLYRTKFGMELRAVGESPEAADARGISVDKVRYLATLVGCGITALGGAYLSLAYTSMWIENMTAGRGWISVALVIFSGWNPLKALLGAYIFGGILAAELRFQSIGLNVSSHILMMLPYIATIIVMALFNSNEKIRKKMGIPTKLGIPYSREERS